MGPGSDFCIEYTDLFVRYLILLKIFHPLCSFIYRRTHDSADFSLCIKSFFSTTFLSVSPRHCVSVVPKQLPSYKNFKGVIHELGQNQYLVSGEVLVIDRNTIEITELPVRTWTQVHFKLFSP